METVSSVESRITVPRWTPSPSPPRASQGREDKALEMRSAMSEENERGVHRNFPFSSGEPPSLKDGFTDEGDKAAAGSVSRIFLTWKDLWVTVPDRKNGSHRPILRRLTGYAEPGEVLAIMGPSGCGKSTLLDALSGKSILLILNLHRRTFGLGFL